MFLIFNLYGQGRGLISSDSRNQSEQGPALLDKHTGLSAPISPREYPTGDPRLNQTTSQQQSPATTHREAAAPSACLRQRKSAGILNGGLVHRLPGGGGVLDDVLLRGEERKGRQLVFMRGWRREVIENKKGTRKWKVGHPRNKRERRTISG
ncbi:hypothetical protein Hypma_003380 [Hypsizygus marmoreus]|uniref:Uncharacterized protein n=1 Tax=Hypsizygus marmoreus TaxID=39966 RepID=A0A369J3Z3_HYPMA|nr:hypothetical protein Hypma_003380 [Hypsizygus marmoreus]